MDPYFSSPYRPNHGSVECYLNGWVKEKNPGFALDPNSRTIWRALTILVEFLTKTRFAALSD